MAPEIYRFRFESDACMKDVHESLLHSRWLYTLGRMDTFLNKYLRGTPASASNSSGKTGTEWSAPPK